MVGKRFASMVLPAPGGPISMALCPPAAAISMARFIFSCPFTSLKSISKSYWLPKNSSRVFTITGCKLLASSKNATTSIKCSTPYTSRLFTIPASLAFASGTINPLKPSLRACMAMGNAPRMDCTVPSKLNSPIIT